MITHWISLRYGFAKNMITQGFSLIDLRLQADTSSFNPAPVVMAPKKASRDAREPADPPKPMTGIGAEDAEREGRGEWDAGM